MKLTVIPLIACAIGAASLTPALAQRSSDPNLRNFYMARQQISIDDDAPVIIDRRTNPQAAQGGGGVGGLTGPMALPKAGWQPYSSQIPGVQTALPAVSNGVPKSLPSGKTSKGLSADQGTLKPKAPAAIKKPSGPVTVQTYRAYKGYGGSLTPSTASGAGSSGGSGYSTSTQVQGSVLHWARKKY